MRRVESTRAIVPVLSGNAMRARILLSSALLVAALGAAAAAPARVLSPYGVNVHAPTGQDLIRLLDRTAEAGIGWIRVDFVWAFVELEPGLYDWSRYDALVREARDRGLEILAILAYTPAWATDGPELSGVPRDPRHWAEFCRRAASRYRGRVRAWEIWNEPNIDAFWSGSRGQYLEEILLPGADAVHAADASALVAGPALAHLTAGDRDWYRWLGDVVAAAAERLDVLTHHVYDRDGPLDVTEKLDGTTPFGSEPALWDLISPSLREVLELAGWKGPVWLSETGWASDEVGEGPQASFLDELLRQWLSPTSRRDLLDSIFVYELEDGGVDGLPAFGLLRADGTPKPAFQAYREFIASHPPASPDALELLDGRFTVEVRWRDPAGTSGFGEPVHLAASSGAFTFFDPGKLDLLVKVLDGRPINGAYWVFFGALSDVEYEVSVTDRSTAEVRTYHNPLGALCGQSDVGAFVSSLLGADGDGRAPSLRGLQAVAGCSGGDACLQDGRFRVSIEWRDPKTGDRRPAISAPVPIPGDDTGLFWFFDPQNLELAVKILDGRGVNGHFWVYAGALSDVEYWIRVADTDSGQVKRYHNPPGTLCGFADIEAF